MQPEHWRWKTLWGTDERRSDKGGLENTAVEQETKHNEKMREGRQAVHQERNQHRYPKGAED